MLQIFAFSNKSFGQRMYEKSLKQRDSFQELFFVLTTEGQPRLQNSSS